MLTAVMPDFGHYKPIRLLARHKPPGLYEVGGNVEIVNRHTFVIAAQPRRIGSGEKPGMRLQFAGTLTRGRA